MKSIRRFQIRSERIFVSENDVVYSPQITNSDIVANIVRHLTKGVDQESFFVFLLNIKNKIIGYEETAKGGIDSCPVDPRIVFRSAIHVGASGILCSHSHPSGDPSPSEADNNITKRLKQASKLLDITFLDHVIVSENSMFSYLANGRMP